MPRNEILKIIADNPALTDAVKDLIVKYLTADKPIADQSDIVLGQMVRAKLVGLKAVEEAFKEIQQYKTLPKQPEKQNPAV